MFQLRHGLCEQLIDSGIQADLIYTDPPYGISHAKWDNIDVVEMWRILHSVGHKRSIYAIHCSAKFAIQIAAENLRNFKYLIHWKKNYKSNIFGAKYQPLRVIEYIAIFYAQAGTYNPKMEKLEQPYRRKQTPDTGDLYQRRKKTITKWYTHIHPTDFVKFDSDVKKDRLHPFQKPLRLAKYIIKTYTNPGDLVIDPYMGSGTAAVACLQLGRDFIGYEIDETYFNTAVRRLKELGTKVRHG